MSGEPASTAEIVQTPRQRVEASLEAKQRLMAEDININYESPKGDNIDDPEAFEKYKREKRKTLIERQGAQSGEFWGKIVNNLPEAEAWEEIEKEELEAFEKERAERIKSSYPRDKETLEIFIHRGFYLLDKHSKAMENLKNVRTRTQNVGSAVSPNKTP